MEFELIQSKAVEGFAALTLTCDENSDLCPTFTMTGGSVQHVNYGYVYDSYMT